MTQCLSFVSQDAIFNAVIAVGAAIGGGLIALIHRSYKNADGIERIDKKLGDCDIEEMKSRVDELWLDRRETWRYLRERGDLEAVDKGLAKRNSPLSIEDVPLRYEIERLFIPYLPRLFEIDKELAYCGDENILFEAVAKRLGAEFIKFICPVIKVKDGGCVSLAIAVLKKAKAGRMNENFT